MKKELIIISICSLLCSCVSHTKYSEALSTIDSLKAKNTYLISEVNQLKKDTAQLANEINELINGENRLVGLYQEACLKGQYIKAEKIYNQLITKHPESQSNAKLSNINIVKKKAQIQHDSIAKAVRDSIRLAHINEMGNWKIGDYLNDFKEPTGEHYVYQTIYGTFSNTATAGSRLRVVVRINKEKNGRICAEILYDEYDNGVINDRGLDCTAKVVCKATRTVYNNYSYHHNKNYSFKGFANNNNKKITSLEDVLRQEQTLEFSVPLGHYTTTIYSFTIHCQYLNNALIKARLIGLDDIK